MKSLAIDHGSNRSGWSVFEDGKYVTSWFEDYTKVPHPQVLETFYNSIEWACGHYNPGLVIIEQQVDIQNHHSTAVLHHMNAIEFFFCLSRGYPFHKFNSIEWRKLIGFKPSTEKLEIAYAISMEFGIDVDKIAVPIRYVRGSKVGQIKEYLCDESDSIALNWAYWRSVKK